jgi:hypothetical protein
MNSNHWRRDGEGERAQLEKRRAEQPPQRERGLDTMPMASIDQRIATAIGAERSLWRGVLAEVVASYDHQIARLEARLDALVAKRSKSDALPLPTAPGIFRRTRGRAA